MDGKPLAISTQDAPQALGPYSQAMRAGDFIFVSGQIGLHPDTQELVAANLLRQAEQVFKNIDAIAKSAGTDFSRCVKINIAMIDLSGFDELNGLMADIFAEPFPARACIGVASLPKGALIEVETIFYQTETKR